MSLIRLHKNKVWVPGFTLVEVLVVVAIIGILASIVLFSISEARQNGMRSRAQEELKNIELTLVGYRNKMGVMPPGADLCTLCAWRSPPAGSWARNQWLHDVVRVVDDEFPVELPTFDPWGRFYAYDNNYRTGGAGDVRPSIVCSIGPDGVLDTWKTGAEVACQREAQDDDICIFLVESDDTPPVCS